MSKGWYVKVETNVVFTVDTNVGVVASCEREAANEAVSFVESNLIVMVSISKRCLKGCCRRN